MGVEDLLQKHSLLESDIHVVGERVKTVNKQAERFVEADFPDSGCKHLSLLDLFKNLLTLIISQSTVNPYPADHHYPADTKS